MARTRTSGSVKAIVENSVPGVQVKTISLIPTNRLLRSFHIKLADERTLLLNLPPPPSSRLLRSERWLLRTESVVVEWLLKDLCPRRGQNTRCLDGADLEGHSSAKSPRKEWIDQATPDALPPYGDHLVDYLPTLIKHSSTSTKTAPTFNLFEPTPGEPISSLGATLTDAERETIDFQKGLLLRRIVKATSPNGRFGPAVTVLGHLQASESDQKAGQEAKLDFDGAESWRKTFHLLLEGVLRDGEDLAVTMSYELVRATFRKFGHLLDSVKTPRLVVCDSDDDDIVLVSRPEKTQGDEPSKQEPEAEPKMKEGVASAFKITGLRDWSNCIFGDPLFATVFSHATPEFDRGFRQSDEMQTKKEEDNNNNKQQRQDCDIIEDPENAPTRILLYECYHATVAIVRQFYRPDAGSSERELAARRRLVATLAKLEHVDVDVGAGESTGKRPRRLSRDDWPTKRPRSGMVPPKGAVE